MEAAFTEVCAIVDSKIIKEGGIIKLSDLREIYVARLEKTPFANPKYRSDSLKAKLVKCYNEHLPFVQLGRQGRYQSSLVHKSSVDIGSLIRMTYELMILILHIKDYKTVQLCLEYAESASSLSNINYTRDQQIMQIW